MAHAGYLEVPVEVVDSRDEIGDSVVVLATPLWGEKLVHLWEY